MTAQIKPFPLVGRSLNQVRADLARIEKALNQSGIRVAVDRGTTDEGDPWLVFCDPDTDDVIAHVTILDGEVVADSKAFARPLRTRDIHTALRQLLRSFGLNRDNLGTNAIIAISVAIAFLHLSDADAANWIPLSPDTLAEAQIIVAAVPAAVIAEVLATMQELMAEAIHSFATPVDPIDLPAIDDNSVSLRVQKPHTDAVAASLPLLAATSIELPMDIGTSVDLSSTSAALAELESTHPHAKGQQEQFAKNEQPIILHDQPTQIESLPISVRQSLQPERIYGIQGDALSNILVTFIETASNYDVEITDDSVIMTGYGIGIYQQYILEDSSSIMLIGIDSDVYEQMIG